MIIFPSINLGATDNSISYTQCSAVSPYALNDFCYLQVINNNPNCCNLNWDQTCEDSYLICKNTSPPPPPPLPPPPPPPPPGCPAPSPYDPSDACYITVVTNDAFCCFTEWDTYCQAAYDVCASQ